MVTEFGAEANRDGPVEEKGTWAFQQDFVNYHLGVYRDQAVAQRRDLLGAERVLGPARAGRAATRARSRRCTRRACSRYDDLLAQARVGGRAALATRHDRSSSSRR